MLDEPAWIPPSEDEGELRDLLPEEGWRAAMRLICARHGLPDDELAPFPSGSDVVWGAGPWVLKLSSPRWTFEIEAEARNLRRLEGRLGVETPRVLATGALEGWPYVVSSRVPGVALAGPWEELEHGERLRLAEDLGELTRELHGVPLDGLEGDAAEGWSATRWEDFWRACRADVRARHARAGVPRSLLEGIEPFLRSVGTLETQPLRFVHTELYGEHVLVERSPSGRLVPRALIDLADARAAPFGYEVPAPVEFLFRGEPGLLRAYLEAYGLRGDELGPELSERLLAFGLCHRFGSLRRMLAAVHPSRPAHLGDLACTLYGLS